MPPGVALLRHLPRRRGDYEPYDLRLRPVPGERYNDQLADLAARNTDIDTTVLGSRCFLDQLAAAGIDFDDVTEYLERGGLALA
jgi:hypothetical protein